MKLIAINEILLKTTKIEGNEKKTTKALAKLLVKFPPISIDEDVNEMNFALDWWDLS